LITLYHCTDARSFRCLWALEELGLSYELKPMAFPPRLTTPSFLEVNPTGTIPWLQDDEVGLSESAAILEYLAVRHSPRGLAVAPDETGYAAWLQWLHFGEASLTVPLATALRWGMLERAERRQPVVAEDYREQFLVRLAYLASSLMGRSYVAAERFTTADISVGYALMLSRMMGLQKSFPPSVQDYWGRLSERPAYRAAKARQQSAQATAVAA
jgi:glutathione S-transferase